jgi:hypothetical protein
MLPKKKQPNILFSTTFDRAVLLPAAAASNCNFIRSQKKEESRLLLLLDSQGVGNQRLQKRERERERRKEREEERVRSCRQSLSDIFSSRLYSVGRAAQSFGRVAARFESRVTIYVFVSFYWMCRLRMMVCVGAG